VLNKGDELVLLDLHIENIAVIERADISFAPGLNVLTGETGAGKSIVIDALQAVLGARTSRELVRTGAEKALASAVFSSSRADKWLEDNDLLREDELILQRRVTGDGKSSCRVCGSPVSAAQLRELSALLLDIHGQNDGRQLMDETKHLSYLDGFGSYGKLLESYTQEYEKFRSIQKEIKKLSMDEEEKNRLVEKLKELVEEIEEAELRPGEEAELSSRSELMRNSEKLREALNSAYDSLYGADESAAVLTDFAAEEVSRAARYCTELAEVESTLKDASFTLRDAAEILRDFLGGIDFSPQEYDRLETRLSKLRRLFKRYGAEEAELLEKLEDAKEKLSELEYSDDRITKLTSQLEQQRQNTKKAAEELTKVRSRAAKELQKRIEEELKELAMPSVSFLVDISPIDGENGFDKTGGDTVRFLMSANKGEKPGPISKIASGGELSRIMLAMKNVFSENDSVETLVFDEIDTGVSGVAAQRVGEKLCELSRRKQVLCVTHLPQIAAMADTHFHIEKSEREGRTYTSVTPLDGEGRKRELARLHGGDNITENTLISAGEQLKAAEDFKKEFKI
jgi:DNA repair protein RecN (Recombination protein N)